MAETQSSLLPSLPDKPHHPKDFAFPKRTFGKSKPVLCSAQSQWFNSWPFLHYDEGQDVVFCHTCVTAFKLDRMKSSNNAASAFVSICMLFKFCLTLKIFIDVLRSRRVFPTGKMPLLLSRSTSSQNVMQKQFKLLWRCQRPQVTLGSS